jgi:hypothetical protein
MFAVAIMNSLHSMNDVTATAVSVSTYGNANAMVGEIISGRIHHLCEVMVMRLTNAKIAECARDALS